MIIAGKPETYRRRHRAAYERCPRPVPRDAAGTPCVHGPGVMTNSDVAFLLPGQGAVYPGVLRHLSEHHPEVRDILQEMDQPVRAMLGCSVTAALLEEEPRSIEHWLANQSDLLQIALTATCVVVHHLLRDAGITPTVLVGHSLGEIAALAAGGAITPAQASEVVCARTIALRQAEVAPGYMLSLATSASRAQALLNAVADPNVAVAVTNHPDQTVVSGRQDAMDRVAAAARELRMGGHRLNSRTRSTARCSRTRPKRFTTASSTSVRRH